jgi:pimeloyl-ACP methyl ester carboxylesterase
VIQTIRQLIILVISIFGTVLPLTGVADSATSKIGVVVMHGKGGSPTKYVNELASSLEHNGYLVANLEMPWSKKRNYDADVNDAEKEVESALAELRSKGAQKLFVAGHSQGGLFALYFGGKHDVDGIIAIAPGGNVSSTIFREKLGASVGLARKLIAEGKGSDKTGFYDFESSKGVTDVPTTAVIYFSWFDPDGAMNQMKAVKQMNPRIPVLYIGPTGDYPGLRNVIQSMFNALPGNPLTRLYEPDSSHLGAPSASRDEIARWITEVAKSSPALQGVK